MIRIAGDGENKNQDKTAIRKNTLWGEFGVYLFFRFGSNQFENERINHCLLTLLQLTEWKVFFGRQEFPNIIWTVDRAQWKGGRRAFVCLSRPFNTPLILFQDSEILNWVKMGEERLPLETLDLIFQLLPLTDLKSAVQVLFILHLPLGGLCWGLYSWCCK